MKKLILTSIFVFFLVAIWPSNIYALGKEDFYDWGNYYQEEKVLGAETEPILAEPAGLLPDSPFYFLKTLQERFQFFFTFEPLRKEELRLKLAEERAAEYQSLFNKGKIKPALAALAQQQTLLDETESKIEELKGKGKNISEIAKKLEEQVARHELVMEKVLEQVPSEAKAAIKRAMENYEKHLDVAADALDKEPIPPAVKTRLEVLKQQGILTTDEVSGLYALPTRGQVRQRLRALEEQGLLPKADFHKLNEAQERVFKEAFKERQERDKFEELGEIEKETVPPEIREQIEAFRKTFKPGEPIPPKIRQFLPLVLRKEELGETLRPDMIDEKKLPSKEREMLKKIKEEMRPREEEIKEVKEWKKERPGQIPPERLQRIEQFNYQQPQPISPRQPTPESGD